MQFLKALFFVTVILSLAGCGRSSEEINTEWDELLSQASSCMEDSECVLITPGCPFGCAAIVNQSRKEELEAKAIELRDELSSDSGMSCNYSCILPTVFSCTNGLCTSE